MAEIFTLKNVVSPTTTDPIWVGMRRPFEAASLELRGQSVSSDGLSANADYVYLVGDPENPTTLAIRINVDAEGKTNRQAHFSVRLRGYVSHVEDSTTPDTVLGIYPYDTVMAWNVPLPLLKDSDTIQTLVMQGFLAAFSKIAWEPASSGSTDAQVLDSPAFSELSFLSPTIY